MSKFISLKINHGLSDWRALWKQFCRRLRSAGSVVLFIGLVSLWDYSYTLSLKLSSQCGHPGPTSQAIKIFVWQKKRVNFCHLQVTLGIGKLVNYWSYFSKQITAYTTRTDNFSKKVLCRLFSFKILWYL